MASPVPIETFATAYFSGLMTPTPTGTRLPNPANTADVTSGFLRLQSAGGRQLVDDQQFVSHLILMAYAPDEPTAENLIVQAVGYGLAAAGQTITVGEDRLFINYSRVSQLPQRQADPAVALTRYRAMVAWQYVG